jgi:hypothetical protein
VSHVRHLVASAQECVASDPRPQAVSDRLGPIAPSLLDPAKWLVSLVSRFLASPDHHETWGFHLLARADPRKPRLLCTVVDW